MLMNRWRVGSISMGIILVASGIIMLISFIAKTNVLNTIITLWPVVMICLGLEILLYIFVKKGNETDVKMKYDVLSIFFIGIILIISTLYYGIIFVSGILGSQENMRAALGIYNETAYVKSDTELTGAKELVVFNGIYNIKAVAAAGENIRVEYRASAGTSDKQYAESVLDNIIEFKNGDRAYVMSNTAIMYSNRKLFNPTVSCVIYLPPEKVLDLSQFGGAFEYDSVLENQIIRS